jgi:exodeoxyribonuclease VIII
MTYSGIVEGLSNELYNVSKAMRSTVLKKLHDATPGHMRHSLDNPSSETSEALLRGQVLHCMVLEPHNLQKQFVLERTELRDKTKLNKNGGSKEDWDQLKSMAEVLGIPLVKHDMYLQVKGMANSISKHQHWQLFNAIGRKELSLFAEIEGVPCKARYDVMASEEGQTFICDLKTSKETLTNQNVQKIIVQYGYHFSAAMYVEIGKALGLQIDEFSWMFVENKAPFGCRMVKASPEMMEIGREEFYKCLRKFKECRDKNEWPMYPLTLDTIDLPGWYANKQFLFEDPES